MSIDLILEVMDHAPANLTPGERMVLVVIAERANDKTRIAKQGKNWTLGTIARRAGVGRDGLRKIFQRLAKNGCEVRVALGTDSRGRPVFAYEGTAMTFKVPDFPKRGDAGTSSEEERQDGSTTSEEQRGDDSTASDGQEVVPQSARGGTPVRERWDASTTQSLINTLIEPSDISLSGARTSAPAPRDPSDRERDDTIPSEDPNPNTTTHLTAAHRLLAKRGIHGTEAEKIISYIHRNVPTPIQGDGWWYAANRNGSLDDWINRYRSTTASAGVEVVENCPLHPRNPADGCGDCLAILDNGGDPWQGRENERPVWWWDAYNRQRRSGGRNACGDNFEGWLSLKVDGHQAHPSYEYDAWLAGQPSPFGELESGLTVTGEVFDTMTEPCI